MSDISVAALAAQVFTGLVLGGIYVLLAVGLSLIFGLMTVVNFSHGALYMLGAYFGFVLVGRTGSFLVAATACGRRRAAAAGKSAESAR